MSTTITSGATVITPTLVTGYETSQETRNIIHSIIGKSSPEVTLRVAMPRSGTLELLFETAAAANTARTTHATGGTFTLASTEIPQANMTYVVSGAIGIALEDETRRLWLVTVDYQEI